jgi:hypothetical protein
MAWTTPATQSTGFLVTASVYNAQIINDLLYLKGEAGGVQLGTAGSTTTSLSMITQVAAAQIITLYRTTDAQPYFSMDNAGALNWGPGGSTVTDTVLYRAAASVINTHGGITSGYLNQNLATNGTWTPDVAKGCFQRVGITSGVAATFTIAAPLNPPDANHSFMLILRIKNTSGATATLAWNAAFQAAQVVALPASVINNASITCLFGWDGGEGKWTIMVAA